jgi:DNA-binding HxlR family transcriptional regulator
VHASVPPRVDYELTELGQTLLVPLGALADWANTHRVDIQAARERHDRQAGMIKSREDPKASPSLAHRKR